jgi:hypothetical protein
MNHPTLTIGATVQPRVLTKLSSRPEFKDLGLLSRFLYAVPNSPLGYRTGEEAPVPIELSKYYEETLIQICNATKSKEEF